MKEVGIVAAMRVEARCITRLRLPFNQRFSLGRSAAIWVCGMGAEAAGEAANWLRAKGAEALMSFGFAGALEPGLNSGDLVLPESVYAGHLLDVDLSWRDSLCRRLPNHFTVAGGILAASNGVLTTDISKRELARATGARAVDM